MESRAEGAMILFDDHPKKSFFFSQSGHDLFKFEMDNRNEGFMF